MLNHRDNAPRSKIGAFLLRILRTLFFCLMVSAFAKVPQEESPARSQQIPSYQIEANLVIVDAIVRDKEGNLVGGLTREDFRVYEDNVLQEIITFSREDIPIGPPPEFTPGEDEAKKAKATVVNLGLNPDQPINKKDIQDKRLIILFFDLSSLGTEDLIRSVDAAREFVAERTGPQDLLAVAAYSSILQLVQDFTNDRELLIRTLEEIVPSDSGDAPIDDLGDEDISGDVFVPDDVQFNIFNTDRRLAALETLAKMYREFPERKSLVYFSSGVRTTGIENNAQIRSAIDNANRSNMSIYTVDSRGLVALPPGGGASQQGAGGRAMFTGAAVSRQRMSFSSSQETLTTLSHDTGGRSFQDVNDLGLVLKQVQEDSRIYYVLGYYSANKKQDGKYRRIRVEVTQSGLRIEHRPGYFASKSFDRLTQDERDLQLQQALSVERPFSDVPLILQADYFRKDDKTSFVPVSIELAGDGIRFEDKGEQSEANFEFLAQVLDPGGRVTGVARDTVRVRLPTETAEKVRSSGIFYSTAFQLRSGGYTLKFLVRDNGTGKLGTFEQPLNVPTIDGKTLATSSIVLGNRLTNAREDSSGVSHRGRVRGFIRKAAEEYDPLVMDDKRVVPSIGNVFLNRQTVYVYFQVYGAAMERQTQKPCIEISLMLLRDQTKILETETQIVQDWAGESRNANSKNSKGVAAVAISLPLKSLKKGTYVLQIHVRDVVADVNLFRRVPIVIEQPANKDKS